MRDEFKEIIINYYEIEKYNFSDINEEMNKITVIKDSVKYEFLLRRRINSDKMVIFGSGAYNCNTLKPPVFQRYSWSEYFDENLIYYNDPTLYLGNISVAWGFGTAKEHFLEIIGNILNIIINNLGLCNSKSVIYGSSAGGFMALMLGAIVKGSKIVINNPQTNVKNYYKKMTDEIFGTIMPEENINDLMSQYIDRLDIVEFYKNKNYIPEVIYYQNMACLKDMSCQLIPFINSVRLLDEKMFLENITIKLYSDKEQNHSPLTKIETINLIKQAINSETILGNVLHIRSNEWEINNKTDEIIIYKYKSAIYGKVYNYRYQVKLDDIICTNKLVSKIKEAYCTYIDNNGILYISIPNNQDVTGDSDLDLIINKKIEILY